MLGLKFRPTSVKWDYIQTLLSRGDGRLSYVIERFYELGGNIGAFKKAYKELSEKLELPTMDEYVISSKDVDHALPWDFIKIQPGKDKLAEVYKATLGS